MANCNVQCVRIDARLVHGQIVTKWSTYKKFKTAIIIDADLAANPFMANFYKKAAPKGIKVEVFDPAVAVQRWGTGTFGPSDRNVMIVLKDVASAYSLWKEGFPLEELNLGNQVMTDGKKRVSREVFLSEDEFLKLKEMDEAGIRVYMQSIPESAPTEFSGIAKAF